jgi:hypothetical protein
MVWVLDNKFKTLGSNDDVGRFVGPNTKVVVIGNPKNGLPLILGQ